jgi:hypothetical protein
MQLIQRCSARIQHFMCCLNRGVAPRVVHVKFVVGDVYTYSRASVVSLQLSLHSVVHSFNYRLGNRQWTQFRSHFQDTLHCSIERHKNSDHLLMTLINMWPTYANFIKPFQPDVFQSCLYSEGHIAANVPVINIYFITMY